NVRLRPRRKVRLAENVIGRRDRRRPNPTAARIVGEHPRQPDGPQSRRQRAKKIPSRNWRNQGQKITSFVYSSPCANSLIVSLLRYVNARTISASLGSLSITFRYITRTFAVASGSFSTALASAAAASCINALFIANNCCSGVV